MSIMGHSSCTRTALWVFGCFIAGLTITSFVMVLIIWASPAWLESRVEKIVGEQEKDAGQGSRDMTSAEMMMKMMNRGGSDAKTVHAFAYEDWVVPGNFVDDTGKLGGVTVELVSAICENQRKQCRHVLFRDANLCWDSSKEIGEGIMDGYAEACVGWVATQARTNVFDFSSPLYSDDNSGGVLYMRKGSGFSGVGTKKVGFIISSYLDSGCLRRAGLSLDDSQMVSVNTFDKGSTMLLNNEIDFFFQSRRNSLFNDTTVYEALDGFTAKCQLSGAAAMFRKDNAVVGWFNEGLKAIRENGKYEEICRNAMANYGATHISCF